MIQDFNFAFERKSFAKIMPFNRNVFQNRNQQLKNNQISFGTKHSVLHNKPSANAIVLKAIKEMLEGFADNTQSNRETLRKMIIQSIDDIFKNGKDTKKVGKDVKFFPALVTLLEGLADASVCHKRERQRILNTMTNNIFDDVSEVNAAKTKDAAIRDFLSPTERVVYYLYKRITPPSEDADVLKISKWKVDELDYENAPNSLLRLSLMINSSFCVLNSIVKKIDKMCALSANELFELNAERQQKFREIFDKLSTNREKLLFALSIGMKLDAKEVIKLRGDKYANYKVELFNGEPYSSTRLGDILPEGRYGVIHALRPVVKILRELDEVKEAKDINWTQEAIPKFRKLIDEKLLDKYLS